MQNKLQKAINLTRKTGDRLIIFDSPRSEDPFVVMSLDDYEKIIVDRSEVRGLTEDELLDKINRDIAIWKSEQNSIEDVSIKAPQSVENFASIPRNSNYLNFGNKYEADNLKSDRNDWPEEGEETSFVDRNPLATDIASEQGQTSGSKKKSHWNIPSERKEAAEEIIEEDRQYLEDINL